MLRGADKRLFLSGQLKDVFGGNHLPLPARLGGIGYINAVLADTPKAFWKCQDASGFPVDSSGNGLDMTAVSGTPTYHETGPYTPQDFSIGLLAAGFTRNIVTAVVNNFTLEVWVMPVGSLASGRIILGNSARGLDGANGINGYEIIWNDTTGKFRATAGNVADYTASAATLSLNSWYHVVVVRDAGTWKYYVNGAIDTANAGTSAPVTPTGTAHFGSTVANQRIAYAAIYESALSAARVAAHYAAAAP